MNKATCILNFPTPTYEIIGVYENDKPSFYFVYEMSYYKIEKVKLEITRKGGKKSFL